MDDFIAELVNVVDNSSGEVVGLLVLTRRRPVAEEPKTDKKKPPAQSRKPKFFKTEVLDAVMAAVGELSQAAKGIDHYGTSNRHERQYSRLTILLEFGYIILKPAHRRKGIGRGLMYHAFSKAKVARIPLIVSSEPQVNNFFVKWDFRKGKHVDFNLAKYAPPYSGLGVFRLVNLIWEP